jgi:hypothetical protein
MRQGACAESPPADKLKLAKDRRFRGGHPSFEQKQRTPATTKVRKYAASSAGELNLNATRRAKLWSFAPELFYLPRSSGYRHR